MFLLGINDLINGIANTPLEAMQTYTDDPLRILRNIRHAITKLGYVLSDEIIIAAQNDKILKLLETKVSRERYAQEFVKILKGYNVSSALNVMAKLGIAKVMFKMPDKVNGLKDSNDNIWDKCAQYSDTLNMILLNENKNIKGIKDVKKILKDKQNDMMLSAFLMPFIGVTYKVKKKHESIIQYFMLKSLPGMGKKMMENILVYHNTMELFMKVIRMNIDKQINNDTIDDEFIRNQRLYIGKALNISKEKWRDVVYLVKCEMIIQGYNDKILNELIKWIENDSDLIECWKWKLIRGNELINDYNMKPGKKLGMLVRYIKDETLMNPKLRLNDNDNKHALKQLINAWIDNNK